MKHDPWKALEALMLSAVVAGWAAVAFVELTEANAGEPAWQTLLRGGCYAWFYILTVRSIWRGRT